MIHPSEQLLERYQRHCCEQSFAKLVDLYSEMVYATALRCVGWDHAMAMDVTQIVFVDLAQKAKQFDKSVFLGGWLHKHTFFLASKYVRKEQRRKKREENAEHLLQQTQKTDHQQNSIFSVLDELIQRLNESDRKTILLRFYQEMTFAEAGEHLGITEDAMRMRLNRALKKLESLFQHKGVVVSRTALFGALSSGLLQPVPGTFATSMTSLALSASALNSASITQQIIHLMSTFHIKTGVVTAVITAAITIPLVSNYTHKQASIRQSEHQKEISLLESTNQLLKTAMNKRQEREKLPTDDFRELLRLRGEVGMLRNQLAAIDQQDMDQERSEESNNQIDDPSQSMHGNFMGTYETTIPHQSVLAVGGWEISPGQRLILFMEPSIQTTTENDGMVTIETKTVQFSDSDMEVAGLQDLRDPSGTSNHSIVFPKEYYSEMVNKLDELDGLVRVSAPGITTLMGQQGSIRQEDEEGNSLEINFIANSGEDQSLKLIATAKGTRGS